MTGWIEWWHPLAAVGAYVLAVSTNMVAVILQRWAFRRFGRWWLEP